jgi:hypothetical protein
LNKEIEVFLSRGKHQVEPANPLESDNRPIVGCDDGIWSSKLGTMNEDFADPYTAKKEPCSPLSHFRLRVSYT